MSVTTAPAAVRPTVTAAGRRPAALRALGILGAVVVALVAWGIGALAGADYWITDSQGTVRIDTLVTVQVTVVLGLLGWGLLALLERLTRHGRTVWTASPWAARSSPPSPAPVAERRAPR